jgi:hypothetical protein
VGTNFFKRSYFTVLGVLSFETIKILSEWAWCVNIKVLGISLDKTHSVEGFFVDGNFERKIVRLINRVWGLYCEISDRGFLVWTERRRSEVHAKNRGLIFHSTDRTSEVNNRFIIWLNWVCEHNYAFRAN